MKTNKYEIDMCNGSIMDKLISFALPLMLSGILQLMFNAVDIVVVGHFTGKQALAAVGSTTALINVFTNLFIGISLGANVLAARFFASGREKEMSDTVHTAILLALISGILMAGIGVISAKGALLLMGTPDNVIAQSTLYMRIYFLGMPFFMLYNYGAAILRAVGDTKRPLLFLVISGCANALLDLILVIGFHLGVAGVATATITAQMISCILVLLCLYRTDSCYQLRFSKLKIKKVYLLQIFQVGIPAGIQSTVINFSNALLQSSVNSFGDTAMAGYTAANNILGFLYMSVNSITQACMSFTSQNYGVGKYKRMDRVLIDCLILTVSVPLLLGCGAWLFGPQVLSIYTREKDVIESGMEILAITTVPYFFVWHYGSVSRSTAGDGTFGSADDPVGDRYGRNENSLDFWIFPTSQIVVLPVYFLSGILDHHDCDAGHLFLFCEKNGAQGIDAGIKRSVKNVPKNRKRFLGI